MTKSSARCRQPAQCATQAGISARVLTGLLLSLAVLSSPALAQTELCSGTAVVLENHAFGSAPVTCIAAQSLRLGPEVALPTGGDLALASPRIELRAPFHVAAGTTFSAEIITGWPENQVVLGPLGGASIAAYRFGDLLNPIETTQTSDSSRRLVLAGRFGLALPAIPADELILVTATGGNDRDAGDDGIMDATPTPNRGRLHAVAPAAAWRAGGQRINVLTDIAWHYSADWVGQVSEQAFAERLNEVANTLIRDSIDSHRGIDYVDLLAFNPADPRHRDRLRFAFTDLLLPGGYIGQIHAGAEPDSIRRTLTPLFGAYLRFGGPGSLANEVRVSAAAFGRGRVTSDRGGLLLDSEQPSTAQASTIFLARDGSLLTLSATPTDDTEILSWSGCNWVADDLTECRVSLVNNRQVEVNFGHRVTELKADFIDLSSATVLWSGERLDVSVDARDTDLLTEMAGIAPDTYVAGLADVGPFLRKVDAVTALGNGRWELNTLDATLDEVIARGSGLLQRPLTHGDLTSSAMASAFASAQSALELLPPNGSEDRVFRLRIASPPAGVVQPLQLRNAAQDVLDCTIERGNSTDGGTLTCRKGSVSVAVTGELDIEIDVDWAVAFDSWKIWNGPSYLKIVPEIATQTRLEVELSGALTETPKDENGNDKWRMELATLPFKSLKFWIGPVPLWIKPEVKIYLGVHGKAEAALGIGVSYDTLKRAGVIYDGESWEEVKFFERSFRLEPPPTLSGKAEMTGYVEVAPFFFIYDATGPGLGLEASIKATATASLQADQCFGQMSYGLDGGLEASFQWETPIGETKLGKLLNVDKLNFKFLIFDQSWPLFSGELDTCDGYISPPALSVEGRDIAATQTLGETQPLATEYNLKNIGERPLPWIAGAAFRDGRVEVTPTAGTLEPGEETWVQVTIDDTGSLPLGTYQNQIYLVNTFTGSLLQKDDHIGSQERPLSVRVVAPDFPTPVLLAVYRVAANTVKVSWSINDSLSRVGGFGLLWSTQGFDGGAWQRHPDYIAPNQREAVFSNLPHGDLYVAIEANSWPWLSQYASSEGRFVPGDGDAGGGATHPLNDTGIVRCGDASSNDRDCPVDGYPGQDAEHGRDALATRGQLSKVGAGHAGFDFTKLDANGNDLPANATAWSCVRDNVTGLIWEVKTIDGGLRDRNHRYTWYNPDPTTNGGHAGTATGTRCNNTLPDGCNTHAFVQAVNAQGLCGANDWRLPDRFELASIVSFDRITPAIDTAYFPNTPSSWFWSASPNANHSSSAWGVNFGYGYVDNYGGKGGNDAVRLVRGGQ